MNLKSLSCDCHMILSDHNHVEQCHFNVPVHFILDHTSYLIYRLFRDWSLQKMKLTTFFHKSDGKQASVILARYNLHTQFILGN